MIEFDQLQWTEEPPRTRATHLNATRMGMRICVYDPPRRGAPHARLFVPQPDIAATLRRQPVRFLTAYSDEHGTRAMAFEVCGASSYEFVNAPRGDVVYVSFGLFAWMNPAVAAYPIRQWAWDGARLIVLLPPDVQKDVAYAPQLNHVSNALLDATPTPRALAPPESAPPMDATPPASEPVAEPEASPEPPLVAEPEPVVSPAQNAASVELDRLAAVHNVKRGRPRGTTRAVLATREAERARTNDSAPAQVFKPRALSAAEQEASTMQVLRKPKARQPVVLPPRTSTRPETDATRLQAGCKFLQLDVTFEPADTGAMCNTTRGSMWLNYSQMRVLMHMCRNVEQGYGATGLSELHNARFRPGDETKALSSLPETEAWLEHFAKLLTEQVGIAFRVETRLYALDAA